jgi:hypothetical protein
MVFRTLLESPDIKLTIFPKSAPALGSSAFAALFFSSSFWALVLSTKVWMKKRKGSRFWKEFTFRTFTWNLVLVLFSNPGKIFSLESFVINGSLYLRANPSGCSPSKP